MDARFDHSNGSGRKVLALPSDPTFRRSDAAALAERLEAALKREREQDRAERAKLTEAITQLAAASQQHHAKAEAAIAQLDGEVERLRAEAATLRAALTRAEAEARERITAAERAREVYERDRTAYHTDRMLWQKDRRQIEAELAALKTEAGSGWFSRFMRRRSGDRA